MDDQIRALAYEVFGLLQNYVQIHNDMLGRKWLAYMKAIDFHGNAAKLSQIEQGLQDAKARALALHSSPSAHTRHREYLQVLLDYVEALSETVRLLRGVADNMMRKASGGDYAMGQYRQELDHYKASVERYTSIGETLKAAWDGARL